MKEFLKYTLPYLILTALVFVSLKQNIDPQYLMAGLPLLAIYYFILDNPYKKHQTILSILFIVWIISIILSIEGVTGNLLQIIVLSLLTIVYFLRFSQRKDKLVVDYLKILAIVIFTLAFALEVEWGSFIIPVLIFTYLLDRLIIRRKMSKTLQIIIFSFMGLVTLTFIVFAQIKAAEAGKERMAAEVSMEEAMRQNQSAEKSKKLLVRLQKELEECKTK